MIQITTCMLMALLTTQQEDVSRQARELIEQLRSDDAAVRDEATEQLKKLGKGAKPELEKVSKDRDGEVARRAGYVLRVFELRENLTPELQKAIPTVVDRLARETKDVWTVVFLEAANRHRHRRLLRKDLEVLAGPALRGANTAELKQRVCNGVSHRLLRSGIDEMRMLLQDDSGEVRGTAASCLAQVWAKEAIPDIARLLKDEHEIARGSAVYALAQLGALEKIPQIRELLSDEVPEVRRLAVMAVRDLHVRDAVPQLEALLRDKDRRVRRTAAQALGYLGAKEVVPRVLTLLKSEDEDLLKTAVIALSALHAKEHAKELIPLLGSDSRSVQECALRALGDLGEKETIPPILKVLQEGPSPSVKFEAMRALGVIGAEIAVPDLLKVLRDGDFTAIVAAEALGRMGIAEAVPDIVERLGDGGVADILEIYVMALGRLRSKETIPVLTRLVERGDKGFVRFSAARAIGEIDAEQGIRHLRHLQSLQPSNDEGWREVDIARELCRLGSTDGVSRLLELAEDGVPRSHLGHLNALRMPTAWRNLASRELGGPIYAPVRQILKQVAEVADSALDIEAARSPADAIWLARHVRVPNVHARSSFVIDMLLSRSSPRSTFILDTDRIRIVRKEEALKFWKTWWAEEHKKK